MLRAAVVERSGGTQEATIDMEEKLNRSMVF